MPCKRETIASIRQQRADLQPAAAGVVVPEVATVVKRRRVVVTATLVVGTALLAKTLSAPPGSAWFFALGLASALSWIVGAVFSGPIALWPRPAKGPRRAEFLGPILLGGLLFGGFVAAKLIAERFAFLAGAVERILARADTGPQAFVLVVALVNGAGEELFFRGAVHGALGQHRPALWTTVIYSAVTIATLNPALVVAAAVMGTVFSIERRTTGSVLAPLLTHLSWSTMMLLFFPR